MKKLALLFCLLMVVPAVSAQSQAKKFNLSYGEVEYAFEVKRSLNSKDGSSLQHDQIYYGVNHKRAGFMGSGSISLPQTKSINKVHVKSIKINNGKLIIKMEDNYEYKYEIVDNNFIPLF